MRSVSTIETSAIISTRSAKVRRKIIETRFNRNMECAHNAMVRKAGKRYTVDERNNLECAGAGGEKMEGGGGRLC